MRCHKGFTLIEVLIAMSITVVVAAIAYQSLDAAMRLSEASEQQTKNIQATNRAMSIMAEDFRHGITRTVRSSSGVGLESALVYSQLNYPMLVMSRGSRINPNPQYFQRSALQRVAYHLENGQLQRWHWPAIDAYSDPEPQKLVILENVESIQFRFFSISATVTAGSIGNKGQWQEQWPGIDAGYSGPATNVMPAAVEVIVEKTGQGKLRRIFELPGSS